MYLSMLILNPRSHKVRRDMGNCRDLHRTILSAFPSTAESAGQARLEFGLLYRVETDARNGRIQLLVQSQLQPDWSHLPKDYLADDFGTLDNPAMKRVDHSYKSLRIGQRLRFRLHANPTRRISSKCKSERSGGEGKRVEIYQPEKQIEWLERKGHQHGFRLISLRTDLDTPNLVIQSEGKVMGRRTPNQPPMKFGSVTFEGVLEISDLETFVEALAKGIGSGKAYGFGLLSIAPASQTVKQED